MADKIRRRIGDHFSHRLTLGRLQRLNLRIQVGDLAVKRNCALAHHDLVHAQCLQKLLAGCGNAAQVLLFPTLHNILIILCRLSGEVGGLRLFQGAGTGNALERVQLFLKRVDLLLLFNGGLIGINFRNDVAHGNLSAVRDPVAYRTGSAVGQDVFVPHIHTLKDNSFICGGTNRRFRFVAGIHKMVEDRSERRKHRCREKSQQDIGHFVTGNRSHCSFHHLVSAFPPNWIPREIA